LIAIAIVRLTVPITDVRYGTLLAYDVGIFALALAVFAGLIGSPRRSAALADLVVELGETQSGSLRDALARAVGDPSLEVGYPHGAGYVDVSGRPLDLPGDGTDRRVTRLSRDGVEVAVLAHDASFVDEPELLEGIEAAARLSAANARLQA